MKKDRSEVKKIISIGTSTGGPQALRTLLPRFPKRIGASILIVQHMPPVFTKLLANRLNELSQLIVKEAEDGEVIQTDTVYVAPGGFHMVVERDHSTFKIKLTKEAPVQGHRPSVDRLLQSLALLQHCQVISILLTGMGSDGTVGLKEIKNTLSERVVSIAEAESSCIIFGMPKAAINEGVVDEVVDLGNMYETIMNYLGKECL